jgi:putative sterol carrier protein
MAIKHPSTTGEPIEVKPAEWFDKYLPKILGQQKPAADLLTASLVCKISGKNGGEWTVDLKSNKIQKGTKTPADAVLEMGGKEFAGLTTGKLDIEKAFGDGKVKFQGNPGVLQRFAVMLQPKGM